MNKNQGTKKSKEILPKDRERISVPKSLQPRMNLYAPLETDSIKSTDSVSIIKEKINDKKEDGFLKNLAEIFRESVCCILVAEKYCEENYPNLLRKITTKHQILSVSSFEYKIGILGDDEFILYESIHPIQKFYITLFDSLREIFKEYKIFIDANRYLYRVPKHNYRESTEEKIYQTKLNEESLKNDYFRDVILKEVMLLQIPCNNLRIAIDSNNEILSNRVLRYTRINSNKKNKNIGQEILVDKILSFFEKNRGRSENGKIRSISELYTFYLKELDEILKEYMNNNIDRLDKVTGRRVNYGRQLTLEGLLRKFYYWMQYSDDFKMEISNYHIYKPESSTEEIKSNKKISNSDKE